MNKIYLSLVMFAIFVSGCKTPNNSKPSSYYNSEPKALAQEIQDADNKDAANNENESAWNATTPERTGKTTVIKGVVTPEVEKTSRDNGDFLKGHSRKKDSFLKNRSDKHKSELLSFKGEDVASNFAYSSEVVSRRRGSDVIRPAFVSQSESLEENLLELRGESETEGIYQVKSADPIEQVSSEENEDDSDKFWGNLLKLKSQGGIQMFISVLNTLLCVFFCGGLVELLIKIRSAERFKGKIWPFFAFTLPFMIIYSFIFIKWIEYLS